MAGAALHETIRVTIPSLADMTVTRSNIIPELCAACQPIDYALEAAGGEFPDATELHGRCAPVAGTTDAEVTVTAIYSEGANTVLKPKTIFCLVARNSLMGRIPQEG